MKPAPPVTKTLFMAARSIGGSPSVREGDARARSPDDQRRRGRKRRASPLHLGGGGSLRARLLLHAERQVSVRRRTARRALVSARPAEREAAAQGRGHRARRRAERGRAAG